MVRFTPVATPRSFKVLLLLMAVSSLLSPYLYSSLALSLTALSELHLWQLVSYLFVLPSPLGFSSLVHLAFNLYLLWTFGGSLLERVRPGLFYSYFFSATLVAGLCALAIMPFSPTSFAGSTPPLYALLIAWVFLNPDAKLVLFFTIPFQAHWLLVGLIGLNLFLDLTSGNWPSLAAYLGVTVYGYCFSLIAWRTTSPFLRLRPFEKKILRGLEKWGQLWKKPTFYHPSKVFDIRSGEPVLDDHAFMNAMLAKISLYGEGALTFRERRRMRKISKKRAS